MSTPGTSSDRNLLFGILALQMDFITRDALIAAMQAWVFDKAKPLGQILTEHGALAADNRDLLDALVQRHLALHDNDPEKSLASLSAVSSVRRQLQAVADPDVQASLTRLTTPPSEPDPLATQATDGNVNLSPAPGLRYRVLRPHAEGGLGKVSVALDEELRREVALKEIKGSYADHPESRARFVLEAEVTGGLEHPGIVPVYGLGTYADGRPYYAMRFIKGDDLKEAIRGFHEADQPGRDPGARRLALRGLLRRFVDVCNAVAYAHSRGVLHRDLKPGNVMLGKYGETLVVDWGLAKPVGRGDAERRADEGTLRPSAAAAVAATQMGAQVGTPAYMSPEQAQGRLDLLGPASDVYSLGAILYNLLTGRAPVQGTTVEEVLANVRRDAVLPPRRFQPNTSRALEAVCLKALALRPEDRYATALALAADVEHWLADEPVSAWPEPRAVRARRWVRRHSALVTGTAAAMLMALVALAVGVTVVSVAWRNEHAAKLREQAAREAEEVAKKAEEAAKELAQQREQEARAKKKLADDRFVLALQTIQTLVFEVQSKLENRPGTRDLREALLKEARQRLDKLAAETAATPGSEHTAVWAHFTLGDVYLQVDLRPTLALVEYQKGYEVAKKQAAADPKDAQAQRDLSISYDRLGDVSVQSGDLQAALRYYQDGLDIRKKQAAADPTNVEAQTDLFISYWKLGSVEKTTLEHAKAREWFRKGLAVLQPLHKEGKLHGQFKNAVAHMQQEIALCTAAEKAVADLDFALKQPAAQVPGLLDVRVRGLLKQNRVGDAAATAAKLADLDAKNATNVYNAACGHALCAAAVPEDPTREQYAARAVALLGKAREAGFFKDKKNVAHLKQDRDLYALRQRDDFKNLLAELERDAAPKPPEPVGPPTPPDRR